MKVNRILQNQKQKRTYRFEISLWGIMVIGVLSFGVLSWMFILGIWVGQSLSIDTQKNLTTVTPSYESHPKTNLEKSEAPLPSSSMSNNEEVLEKIRRNMEIQSAENTRGSSELQTEQTPIELKESMDSSKIFFTLQVASLRDPDKAEEVKTLWEKKGYEAFTIKTEIPQRGIWYRVQIGRFNTITEADTAARGIGEKEKIKLYITTSPVPGFSSNMKN